MRCNNGNYHVWPNSCNNLLMLRVGYSGGGFQGTAMAARLPGSIPSVGQGTSAGDVLFRPGIAIFGIVLAFNLLGDALDPRLKTSDV